MANINDLTFFEENAEKCSSHANHSHHRQSTSNERERTANDLLNRVVAMVNMNRGESSLRRHAAGDMRSANDQIRNLLQNAQQYLLFSDSMPSASSTPLNRSVPKTNGEASAADQILMGCDAWTNYQNSMKQKQNSSEENFDLSASLMNNLKISGRSLRNMSATASPGPSTPSTPSTSSPAPSLWDSSPSTPATPIRGSFRSSPSFDQAFSFDQDQSSRLFDDKTWSTGNSVSGFEDSGFLNESFSPGSGNKSNSTSLMEATCTWHGQLPPRKYENPKYSCKVFLGGVPWDISELSLMKAFACFGQISIQWPVIDSKHRNPVLAKGYVYILFEREDQVKSLLQACTYDCSRGGNWYLTISSQTMKFKEVQVIPWVTSDSDFVRCPPSQRLHLAKTVFVGGLHGLLNAEGLAHIMNDLFGGVVYAGIDTDKYRYPIGSGRVKFNNNRSYMRAVAAAFVKIKTAKFTKKIQVDPYLEDSACSSCTMHQASYFCRDTDCFKYYCWSCWQWQHSVDSLKHHKPLTRNTKTTSAPISTPNTPM